MRYMKIPNSNYIICNPNIWFRIFSKFIDLLFAYPFDIMLNQMLYSNFLWIFSNLAKIIVCTHNELVITRIIILANIFVTHLELIFSTTKIIGIANWKHGKEENWDLGLYFQRKYYLKSTNCTFYIQTHITNSTYFMKNMCKLWNKWLKEHLVVNVVALLCWCFSAFRRRLWAEGC